jgi:hypothetical protein
MNLRVARHTNDLGFELLGSFKNNNKYAYNKSRNPILKQA